MKKESIRHEYLRKCMEEIVTLADETPDDTVHRLFRELSHSCLIMAGFIKDNKVNIHTADTEEGDFGLLFTDMDEFRKAFPNFDVASEVYEFNVYKSMYSNSNLKGFIINCESEGFILIDDLINLVEDSSLFSYSTDDSYTSDELKSIKDLINNESLENFIRNPQNIGRYDELFEEISTSTILVIRLLDDDLNEYEEDGVISLKELGPLGFLHMENIGGKYATIFTSEEKMANIDTPFKKYAQILNFSLMTNHLLCEDMDGIIINPSDEHIVLTRDILLEYSQILEKTCNNPKLNSAAYYIFPMEA